MKNIFFKREKSENSDKIYRPEEKPLISLNATNFLDKNFDFKQCLTLIQNQIDFEKKLKSKNNLYKYQKSSTNYPNFYGTPSNLRITNNRTKKLNFTNYNSPFKHINRDNSNIFLNNKSNFGLSTFSNNYYSTSNSNFNKRKKNLLQNINKSKSSKSYKTSYNKSKTSNFMSNIVTEDDDSDEEDEKHFNVSKTVKQIKQNCFLTSIYKNNKNYNYDKKHADIISDSDKILRDFRTKNYVKINGDDISLTNFLEQSKKLSVKNLLMKLMSNESSKLYNQECKISNHLLKNKNFLDSDEKKFNEYVIIQKETCKKLENILNEIQSKNKNLKEEENKFQLQNKTKEDELQKILTQINKFRYYAKFTNEVLGGDSTRFEKPIIPEIFEPDIEYDYNKIAQNVFRKYGGISTSTMFGKKKEGYFLNDPENMFHKYREIEDNTLRMFDTKFRLNTELEELKKQNNDSLSYLKDRCSDLENEYFQLVEFYNEQLKKFNSYKGHDIDNDDIYLIKDIFGYIIKIFKSGKKEIKFNEIQDYVNEGTKLFLEKETLVNDLHYQMKVDEEEDKKLFDDVINYIKKCYKEYRQKLFKQNYKQVVKNTKEKTEKRSSRVVIISRKTEAPFHINKKKEKKVIDYNLIRQNEDKELLTYQ